ncbi:uncharacterized protein E0L32_007183 [Thyridium curvatum]|uniref:Integral membrane protein n=1 Tax=Thyridium curvatum TaxID=1093900 RepID=A0A507B5E1_9PEZI|nr:uncharacterized protein E0L32_007183 [Thyridium curvatum]TPX12068.1 hypothetical protein E0L32_007183 [Thyridium curvatum]
MSRIVGYPPADYVTPPFPALYWPPQTQQLDGSLYYLSDIWRFTLLWTITIFAIVHLICASVALAMQIGNKQTNWLYMGSVPIIYCIVAGVEALFAGSIVGLV